MEKEKQELIEIKEKIEKISFSLSMLEEDFKRMIYNKSSIDYFQLSKITANTIIKETPELLKKLDDLFFKEKKK